MTLSETNTAFNIESSFKTIIIILSFLKIIKVPIIISRSHEKLIYLMVQYNLMDQSWATKSCLRDH